jgi:ABC-type antimicrobial peptide transport system permease subunit
VFAELLGAFAAVALLLAATGVYALLSFFVAQRTRELGLRVALGAVRPQVVRLVLRQSAALASVGVALGLAGALAASRWLAHLLYGVAPLQPLALLAAGAACVAVIVLATWGPARRASAADPMEVLRAE